VSKIKQTNEKGIFIDIIQDWFSQKHVLWRLTSLITLTSIVILLFIFTFLTEINTQLRNEIFFIVMPFLALFVFSIFWQGSVITFLSLAGALNLYIAMFYVYDYAGGLESLHPFIANRLGYGKVVMAPPVSSIVNFHLLIGITALILSTVVAYKPDLFKAKGTQAKLPYPIWTTEDQKLAVSHNAIILIPVISLLNFAEHHLIAKYKYIQVIVRARIYFVSPYDWVPQGSNVIRDKESGSLLGIPKVPDGFNIW
jgi:hypothetical protein